ncbi:MAG: MMPL family transporter [Acidimicrobiales bacterium]
MRTLAGWCVHHRRLVVLIWFVILVAALGFGTSIGSDYSNSFSLPNTQSTDAIKLLQAEVPKSSGDVEQVVFETTGGAKVTDPDIQARISEMTTKLKALPHVVTPLGAQRVSPDGTVGFIPVTLDQQIQNLTQPEGKRFVQTATSVAGGDLHVAVSGQLAELSDRQPIGGTLPGVILALLVLLLVFGSAFAAVLPILSALFALGTAIGLIELLSHVLKMPVFATDLVLLIGLGVGIDYALFIVTRHRQGLVAGRDPESSIVNAVNTSGRAVLFAGIIVCIALLGMFALGVSFLYGLAVAASIGVALTMIAALTLLPAMLGFIGPKVMSRKQKRNLAENGPRVIGADNKGFWPRWADRVQRLPIVSASLALIVVVAIALPFFSLRLGSSDQGSDPVGTTTRTAYDWLAQGFGPGFNGPLQLVSSVHSEGDRAVVAKVAREVQEQPGVASVTGPIPVTGVNGKTVDFIEVYPTSSPQSAATTNLIYHLRNDTIPKAVGDSGVKVLVGGTTALFVDFANVLTSKLPLFIGLVVLMSFILLSIVFRSFVIPLTAAVMNLLSIGAAFGIVVAVFEWGDGASLIGVSQTGPVESFLPVMLFAILFGLSMDYQVFLVTRIHEEYIKSGDNKIAVRNGLAATGKTITAAALIMILVFGSFIFGGVIVIKEFGVGLAGGIFVDAVLIRMCVVPSVMMMLGKANWWFPAWLDRILPHLAVDAQDLEATGAWTPPDAQPELADATTS